MKFYQTSHLKNSANEIQVYSTEDRYEILKTSSALKLCRLPYSAPLVIICDHLNFCHTVDKWTKISSLEINIFDLKIMVKNGLESFILKFNKPLQRYLLTRLANLAFLDRSFLHWAAATLKGLSEFENKKV